MESGEIENISAYKCSKCDIMPLNEHELRLHNLLVHTNNRYKLASKTENNYICSQCGKCVNSKSDLTVHIHHHELTKKKNSKSASRGRVSESNERNSATKKKRFEETIFNCPECFQKFTKKHSFIGHFESYHPLHLDNLDICDELFKPFECSQCDDKFFLSTNLLDHVRRSHTKASNKSGRRLECSQCHRKYPKRNLFVKHISKFHPSELNNTLIPSQELKNFACNQCPRKFSAHPNLLRHIRNFHALPDSILSTSLPNAIPKSRKYTCSACGSEFTQSCSLKRHVKKNHPSEIDNVMAASFVTKRTYNQICPLCCTNSHTKFDILNHFVADHDIEYESEDFEFRNMQAFLDWKKQMEETAKSNYIRSYSYSRNTHDVQRFVCHRSGYYKPRGEGIRYLKMQGTKKIDGYCPSELKLMIDNNNACKVRFFKTHVGHENELRHVKLTEEERDFIAEKLDAGVSSDKILMEIRNSIPESFDGMKRIHLINRKDVYNIAFNKRINWAAINRDSSARLEPEITKTSDSVLFYKRRNEKCDKWPDLEEEDFVLVLMTDTQKINLEKYGNDVVSIDDGLHGIQYYDYEMSTILVVDELKNGYPCCYLLSNRKTEYILRIFLAYIEREVGRLTPNILVTDLSEYYYKAWSDIMGVPNFRVLCSWQVYHTWVRNLPQIEALEKRDHVESTLKVFLTEPNQTRFEKTVKTFLDNDDPQIQPFKNYFETFFLNSVRCWAHCYLLLADVDIEKYVESFHNTIKNLHVNVKTLDMNVGTARLHLGHNFSKEIAYQLKGKMMHKLSLIRQKHKISLDGEVESVIAAEYGWHVPSVTDNDGVYELYFVQQILHVCDCKLICKACKACIHQYVCNCQDSTALNNMCEHIHLVCRFRNSHTKEYDEDEENTMVNAEEINIVE